MLTIRPCASTNSISSGINVLRIHIVAAVGCWYSNSMPSSGARLVRNIRPCVICAGVFASSTLNRDKPLALIIVSSDVGNCCRSAPTENRDRPARNATSVGNSERRGIIGEVIQGALEQVISGLSQWVRRRITVSGNSRRWSITENFLLFALSRNAGAGRLSPAGRHDRYHPDRLCCYRPARAGQPAAAARRAAVAPLCRRACRGGASHRRG